MQRRLLSQGQEREATFRDAPIEAAARALAGQYMVDDGYGEASRKSAERGEMWHNFKAAAQAAISAAAAARPAPSVKEVTELLRAKMCGPHQECDDAHDCICREGARAVIEMFAAAAPPR